ncbi:MAG TPA: hypothetical protein VNZ56_03620 [Verrucomicrobiae bacterium]|nr:hypothetical protein [Verrucomicrobiae bacterium]
MKLRITTGILIVALALCASAAFAQDQKQDTSPIDPNAPLQPLDMPSKPANPGNPANPNQPVGVIRGAVQGPDNNQQQYDPAQVTPDQNTLAGVAPYTLGALQHAHNIFDPTITVSQLGEGVPGTTGKTVLTGESVASATLNFNRVWSEYQFSAVYNGGETFNEGYGAASTFFGQTASHYQYHNLGVTQAISWARWHLLLRDSLIVSPGAAFTSQGLGGPGLSAQFSSILGNALSAFGQENQPAETVDTGAVMRYSNSVIGQAEYSVSRRSTITFAGSYGLLDFNTPGYFNSTMAVGQAGYDYQIDRFNSIAFLGSYGQINFSGTGTPVVGSPTVAAGNTVTDYSGAFAYGRRITGRLAFQAAVGPQEIETFHPGGAGNFHQLFVSVNSALSYERRRGGVSLGYARALTAGSGVYLGATSNTVTASAHYQFTRYWTGFVNGGYALNLSLAPAGASTTQFDNWFIGANIGRSVGTHMHVNFNYGATQQNNAVICLVASCGGVGLQQTVGMSINWHLRPAG